MKRLLFLILLMVTITFTEEGCDNDDYFYWPMMVDSLEIYKDNIQSYFHKEDSLLYHIRAYEKLINYNWIWRAYYDISVKYEKLEKLSKNKHPGNEKKYKKLKELNREISSLIRVFIRNKRLTR